VNSGDPDKKNFVRKKRTNLHINRATQEKQTSSVGKLYTIQFIRKIIHNTIYTEAKLKKKIGSMNGLCHFFLYTRVETWKHLFLKGQSESVYRRTQWPKEKVHKIKQRSTKHIYKTKDRVARTPLKTGGELR
jgi:hypothetical protein